MSTLLDSCPEFMQYSNEFMGGLTIPQPPAITTKGTQFYLKENGEESRIEAFSINVVLLRSRQNLSKTFYLRNFTPGQEPMSPDCASENGIKPTSGDCQQHTQCAGCPQNEFGTSKNADGSIGKGKACKDSKILAVLYKGGIYQLKVPPASLKGFGSYMTLLASRGLLPLSVMTNISFDETAGYPQLKFAFAQALNEQQVYQLRDKANSSEALAIINIPGAVAGQKQLAAPAEKPKQVEAPPVVINVDDELGLTADEEDFPAPPAPKPTPEKPKAAAKPKATPPAGPSAQTLSDELGLNL
jgi:hypothetical protein